MDKGLYNPEEYKKVWEKVKSGEYKYSDYRVAFIKYDNMSEIDLLSLDEEETKVKSVISTKNNWLNGLDIKITHQGKDLIFNKEYTVEEGEDGKIYIKLIKIE